MRLVFALFAVVVGSAIGIGCAAGTESILKPSQVSPQFKGLDGAKTNPFATGKTKIEVLKVGIPNYDKFFADSAEVKGTVVLADVVLKDTDSFLTTTQKNVKAGKALTPAETTQLNNEKNNMAELVKLLEGVPQRSDDLVKAGEGLTKGVEKTFVGPNATKIPAVLKGLGDSTGDLKDAATQAPGLLTHAKSTAGNLEKLVP
jgi:hypothetical protein